MLQAEHISIAGVVIALLFAMTPTKLAGMP